MPATAGMAERNNGAKASGGSASGKTEGRPAGGSSLERVTVNLTLRSARALELATQLTGDSKTDVLNRAIQIYAYLEHAISKGGSVHVQESADSGLELVKFF